MNPNNSSFKESLKATSLFGGVQIYNILIGIIRSKVIAVLLGPTGMGISGLYTSATSLINSISSLGLGTSAVRNISIANESKDLNRISLVVSVFRRLVWYTGIIGLLICLFLSPVLSKITFGDSVHTLGFIILSCTLLFQQLTSGQNALLQGMHKYKYMAKANVYGNTLGLVVTVPLYYYFGLDGIVPVLIISSIVAMILAYYYSKKVNVKVVNVTRREVCAEGKSMIVMGFMISLSSILSVAASYLVRIFISNTGSINDVGLYNAGFAIINTYVGMIFTAMGADYYPRLSAANKIRHKFNIIVNNQIAVALIVAAPIVSSSIIYMHILLYVLYSNKFLAVDGMIYWATLATFFKALSWALGFTFISKGNSKMYFYNELIANIYILLLNVLFYKYWGLTGLGISFFIGYILYMFQNIVICRVKYKIIISDSIYKILLPQFIISSICLLLVLFCISGIVKYTIGTVMFSCSLLLSYKEMNKRINIKKYFLKRISNE